MTAQLYCAASSVDDECWNTQNPTWWGAALEWFADHEDLHYDVAQQMAMDRDPIAGRPTEYEIAIVTCGIARCRKPVSPALMFRTAGDARSLLEHLTADHDDYILDCSEGYPQGSDEQMRDLAQELRCTIESWEARHKLAPRWFIVEDPVAITYGLACQAQELATRIDAGGILTRYEHDATRWWPPSTLLPDLADGSAMEVRTLDLWQAARCVGLSAPDKPTMLP